ncbi:MAG: tetratricopeptide repeat protein [Burkholderiaceae bacterium]
MSLDATRPSWLSFSFGQVVALLLVVSAISLSVAALQYLLSLAGDPVSRTSIGQQLLKEQRPLEAALVFEQADWQAVAHFRATRYRRAAQIFQTIESTEALYNYGVSLARLRRWDDAIAAFRVVLDAHPEHEDARFNYELIRQVIEEKTEQRARQEGADQGGQLHEVSEDVDQPAVQSAGRESDEAIKPDTAAGGKKPPQTAQGQSNDGNASPQQSPGQRQKASAAQERQASDPSLANLGDRTSDAAEKAPDTNAEQSRTERNQSEARLAQDIQARQLVDDPARVLTARLQAAAEAAQLAAQRRDP